VILLFWQGVGYAEETDFGEFAMPSLAEHNISNIPVA